MADRSSSPAVKHAFWSLLTLLMGLLTTAPAQTPPPNDNRANAIELTGTSGSIAVDTTYATAEPGEPPAWNVASKSVWFRASVQVTGSITVSTCDANFDSVLAIYRERDMFRVAQRDNGCESGQGSRVSHVLVPGETYRITLDSMPDSTGGVCTLTYVFSSPRPENDEFEAARVLSGRWASETGYNLFASSQPGEPRPSGRDPQSVWYQWTATEAGATRIANPFPKEPSTTTWSFIGEKALTR